jgi:serine/threonine protein kinase
MSDFWTHDQFHGDGGVYMEDYGAAEHDRHATLRYNDIASAGPPARPLDFPAPEVFRGERVDLRARDHKSGTIHYLKNVLLRSAKNGNKYSSNRPGRDTAYLVTKKISNSVYGCVNLCIVLKRIDKAKYSNQRSGNASKLEDRQDDDDDDDDNQECPSLEWESTDHLAAIKISEWKKIHALRGKHLEDPIKEIAAMQLFGNHHPHIVGTLEVLQDDKCLYTVMPYLGGGDLYGRLIKFTGSRSGNGMTGFDETSARIWFRQLLLAVNLLQKKGVCHRDICLENLLLGEDDNICLIDPGLSLRIPYTDSETGGVGDVSAGTSRRLMVAQGQGGKLMYAAPEIIANETEIDPFATDLWSVGVVLFIMVVGLAPFRWAHPTDRRYASISSGGLRSVVKGLGICISPEACDLLQGFFWADNQKRFTLAEIMRHPWVQGRELIYRPLTLPRKAPISVGTSMGFSFGTSNPKNKNSGKKQSSSSSWGGRRTKKQVDASNGIESDRHHLRVLNHDTFH